MTTAAQTIQGLASAKDLFALTKPRVMSLVIFTALCGLLAAPGSIHPVIGFTAILAISLGAGASAALNQWYESDIDAVMKRTSQRPLPAGRMDRETALHFGIGLSAFSVLLMGLAVNWFSAAFLAFAIFFYAVIYTIWLKRSTPQNIVIGGAAGAFPPAIGWAAVTGDVTLMPVLLFSIIFFWTPPHFWALALFVNSDYSKAGVPMMPVVAGRQSTRHQIFGYSLVLAAVAIAPFVLGLTGAVYGAAAIALSSVFCVLSWQVALSKTDEPKDMAAEKRLFKFSILYLFALFAALVADRMILA
ncbi:heme o synthase [Parasphingorhabdus sp.]|uniref:heme o synthase n=1 Tax=Parasphingorhabdus sp. TaxID=2709688 RepID=UPI003A9097BA